MQGQVVPASSTSQGRFSSHTWPPALFWKSLPTTSLSKILSRTCCVVFLKKQTKNLPRLKIRKSTELLSRFMNLLHTKMDIHLIPRWSDHRNPVAVGLLELGLLINTLRRARESRGHGLDCSPRLPSLEGATESCLLLLWEWEFRLRFLKKYVTSSL